MKRLLLLAGALALAMTSLPRGAEAQGLQIGATVESDGNCPTLAVLNPGVGRYVYVTSKGALCISGNITGTFTPAATPPYVATPKGYQQVTVGATAIGFTPPAGATFCYIQTESQTIRYESNGTPTATVGNPLPTGVQLLLSTTSLASYLAISETGTTVEDIDCYA